MLHRLITFLPLDPVPAAANINVADIVKSLRSFPNGTAPGPSGLRANHLKEAIFCPGLLLLFMHSPKLLTCLFLAKFHRMWSWHLCGANLLAVKKKGGGRRPIAVGEVLRRLVSKCISRAVRGEVFRVLTPLQLGVHGSASGV